MFTKAKHRTEKILRQSERYMQTDMVYLAKGGSLLTLSKIVVSLAWFALAYVFANFVDPNIYGNYKFVLAGIGIFTAFSLTGFNTAMSQAIARGFDGVLKEGYKKQVLWSIPASLISLTASGYYFFNENYVLGTSFLVSALFIPLYVSAPTFSTYLIGKKRFLEYALFDPIYRIVPILAIVGVIFFTPGTTILLVSTSIIATALMGLVGYWYFAKQIKNEKDSKEAHLFGTHLSFMNILGRVVGELDKILLFHYLGAVELAVYAFAIAIPQQIKGYNSVLKQLVLPKFSVNNFSTLQRTLPWMSLRSLILTIPLVAIYIVLAPHIFSLFFSQYQESVAFSQVYSIVLLFAIPALLYTQGLSSHMKTKSLYVQRTVIPLAKLGFLVVLTPLFGIWGVVYTLVGTQALSLLLSVYLVHTGNPSSLDKT